MRYEMLSKIFYFFLYQKIKKVFSKKHTHCCDLATIDLLHNQIEDQ